MSISTDEKISFSFDEDTVIAFTEGDCWMLALALAKKLNLRIGLVGYAEEDLDADYPFSYPFSWAHAFVELSKGVYVDVKGIHSDADLINEYSFSGEIIFPTLRECNGTHFLGFTRDFDCDPEETANQVIELLKEQSLI